MSDQPAAPHFTERMAPEDAHPRTFWEHVARYRFARKYVRGRRVLDIACGEGYGTAGLARAGASSVIGIDAAPEVCERARHKYGIDARPGDALAIPLPDRSIDVVVSFETIEHVDGPAGFLRECARVLVPEGTLIVSTPNRPVYSGTPSGERPANPFHRVELDEQEFERLLDATFQSHRISSQFPQTAAWWSPRSLAAERSPWLRVRGYWRLASSICPALRNRLGADARANAHRLALAGERFPASLFNPYLVRPRSKFSRERPYILIAVAQGPRARQAAGA